MNKKKKNQPANCYHIILVEKEIKYLPSFFPEKKMQHHSGSWYLPWGVPLQKMLAVPFNHPGAAAAVGYHHQSQQPLQVPPPTTQPHQQHQNYPHQIHPTLHPSSAAALHQQIHPAAAAAMFTPISLRTFINPSANHMSLNQQQSLQSAVQPSPTSNQTLQNQNQSQLGAINLNVGVVPIRQPSSGSISTGTMILPVKKVITHILCTI